VTDSIVFDFSEVNKLVADLNAAPLRVIPNLRKAVEVTARNVKDDWQKNSASRSGIHAKKYPSSVDYDLKLNFDGQIGAEIGPNLGKAQGPLGILEDATGGVRSRPQHAGRDALQSNEADFEKGIRIAVDGLLS